MSEGTEDSCDGSNLQELPAESGTTQIDRDEYNESKNALQYANSKIYSLQSQLEKISLNIDGFRNDDRKTLFYTGLKSFDLLVMLHNFLKSYISDTVTLSSFEQCVLTLMKLRQNFSLTDIAYRFGVSRQTSSRVFFKCINVMYYQLKWLIHWPTKEELLSTMPKVFKECFGNKVTTIIDCFEVFSERASNPDAAASMFSNYKHHQTVKFLIAVSPQGTIMFISNGYGGRASDKHITETCGLLDKLSPGDLILADRGFLIKEVVFGALADVKTPAFLKGKKQMNPVDIEESRKLSSVRIHVERVIGTLKQKYTILHETLPIDLIKYKYEDNIMVIDKIVLVCSVLFNLNPSIVISS